MKRWRNVVPCQNYSWVWWTFPPGQSHLWTRVLERKNAGRTCSWARGRYSSLRACVSFPSFCERAASVCERWPNAGLDSVKDSICGRKTNRRFFYGRQEIKIFNFVWESRINWLLKTLNKQFESHTVCNYTVPSYHLERIVWNWFTLCLNGTNNVFKYSSKVAKISLPSLWSTLLTSGRMMTSHLCSSPSSIFL